jgi:hypothetical protein
VIERAAAHLRHQAILAANASHEEDVAAGGEAAGVCRDDGSRCGRCTTRCPTRCAPRSCSARSPAYGSRRWLLGPWVLERAVRAARPAVKGLPAGFRFHDLKHDLASLLIASGANVKVVQARLRHASATTTLDCYGHLLAR